MRPTRTRRMGGTSTCKDWLYVVADVKKEHACMHGVHAREDARPEGVRNLQQKNRIAMEGHPTKMDAVYGRCSGVGGRGGSGSCDPGVSDFGGQRLAMTVRRVARLGVTDSRPRTSRVHSLGRATCANQVSPVGRRVHGNEGTFEEGFRTERRVGRRIQFLEESQVLIEASSVRGPLAIFSWSSG